MPLRSIASYLVNKLPKFEAWKIRAYLYPPTYVGDNMALWGRNTPFDEDIDFAAAYKESMSFAIGPVLEMDVRWRAFVCLWAARQGLMIEGDFVECGVSTGIMSGTICRALKFGAIDRKFYLFDTYEGIPIDLANEKERPLIPQYNKHYLDVYDLAKRNFSVFQNAILVKGRVPETLDQVSIEKVAYLSIDMNITFPERAALEFFWPKLAAGAVIVLDDIGFTGFEDQRTSASEFAKSKGVSILYLPTGQGIIVKPEIT
jgi:O-methyltransferase